MNSTEAPEELGELQESGLILDFAVRHPRDFARVISGYDGRVAVSVLKSLPDEALVPIASYVSQEIAISVFQSLENEEIAQLLNTASIDEACRIVQRLPQSRRAQVMSQLSDSRNKKVLNQFVHLGAKTVGGLANKDFLWFSSAMYVDEVRRTVRSSSDRRTVESAIVLNSDETVLGLLDYISLTRANGSDPVGNCVEKTTLVPAESRPHAVVHFDDWHRVNRLPVVDQDQMPVGVLHWSQLAEVTAAPKGEDEHESFNISYEVLDTGYKLVKSLLTLPDGR